MSSVQIAFVLPSIKISGGQREALRIADDVQGPSVSSRLVTMWLTDSPMPTGLPISPLSSWMTRIQWAALQVPALCLRFHRLVAHLRGDPRPVRVWVFTHYATLILAPFVPRSQRWFFVQGVEWLFVRNPLLSRMLRLFISTVYQSGRVIAANPYLTNVLIENDIPVAAEKFIWADAAFFTPSRSAKDIDLVMVLRKGKAKRLDLYAEFLAQVRQRAGRRIAFITHAVNPDFRERYAAYAATLAEHAIALDPALVLDTQSYRVHDAYHAVRRMIGDGRRFDAAFCANDWLAFGTMQAVQEAGWRIPEDVADAVVWLIDGARTVTGELLLLDSGVHLGARRPVQTGKG